MSEKWGSKTGWSDQISVLSFSASLLLFSFPWGDQWCLSERERRGREGQKHPGNAFCSSRRVMKNLSSSPPSAEEKVSRGERGRGRGKRGEGKKARKEFKARVERVQEKRGKKCGRECSFIFLLAPREENRSDLPSNGISFFLSTRPAFAQARRDIRRIPYSPRRNFGIPPRRRGERP